MHEQEFQIGDVVILNSEEHNRYTPTIMTIAKYYSERNEYGCIYFDAYKVLQIVSLPEHCLMRYKEK